MIPGIVAGGGNLVLTEIDQSATERRYLRFQMATAHASGGLYTLSQLAAYETLGGPDVLAGSGAVITASSLFDAVSHNTDKLVDGNDSTWCATGAGGTQHFKIDWGLNAGRNIKALGLKCRTDNSFQQFPLSGTVAYSADDATYTTDWTYPMLPISWPASGTFPLIVMPNPTLIPSVAPNHRIWGINANAAGAIPEFAKLEMRATLGGAQLCVAGGNNLALSNSPFNTGFYPMKGFDGAGSQMALGAIPQAHMFFDFGEGDEIPIPAQLALTASGIPSRCFTDFDLFYVDALGQAPTDVRNFTTPATWTGGETRLFNT